MIRVLLTFIGGYLVGSIPVAYLLVRSSSQIDIRASGSGNAGGFNAYVVTRSKLLGILVGVLDAAKGLAAVYVASLIFPDSLPNQAVALLGAIGGHNYSIWLKFKGGRGLSTTAGGMFLLGFSYTLVWCFVWLLARAFKREILTSNLLAILFTPALLYLLPWRWVYPLVAVSTDEWTFLFFACVTSTVLLISHFDVVSTLWGGKTTERQGVQSS